MRSSRPSTTQETKEGEQPKQKFSRSSINMVHKKIDSFASIKIPANCSQVDLSKNKISNFEGLTKLDCLTQLQLDYCPIKTFKGAMHLPSLRWLSMKGTPVSRNNYFKLMCIVVFGPQLKTINDEKVPQAVFKQVEALEDSLRPQLLEGRLLSHIKPIRLIDPVDDKQITPNEHLLNASINLGYTTPLVKEITETQLVAQQVEQKEAKPTIAVICNELLSCSEIRSYVPQSVISEIHTKLQELRSQYDAVYSEDEGGQEADQSGEENNTEVNIEEEEEDVDDVNMEQQINEAAKQIAQSSDDEESQPAPIVEEEDNNENQNESADSPQPEEQQEQTNEQEDQQDEQQEDQQDEPETNDEQIEPESEPITTEEQTDDTQPTDDPQAEPESVVDEDKTQSAE